MKKNIHMITFVLVLVGAFNWGLIGLLNFNLVESLGLPSGIVETVYILVGASAVYELVTHPQSCKTCSDMTKSAKKK